MCARPAGSIRPTSTGLTTHWRAFRAGPSRLRSGRPCCRVRRPQRSVRLRRTTLRREFSRHCLRVKRSASRAGSRWVGILGASNAPKLNLALEQRCRIHPAHSQISLESYLLLPIQRIPRYRMLLGTLAACTPSLSDDSPVEQAVRDLEGMATMLNESKRENEGRAQLIMWQNRLVSKFKSPLAQPHRTLLRSGVMVRSRSALFRVLMLTACVKRRLSFGRSSGRRLSSNRRSRAAVRT